MNPKSHAIQKINDAEFAYKRVKGLSFWCEGKYGPVRKFPSKTLQILLIKDEEVDEEQETKEHVHLDRISVSASLIVGFTTPHTMKLWGRIGEQELVILIDSWTTHNILSLWLVGPLGLTVKCIQRNYDGKGEIWEKY